MAKSIYWRKVESG